ncbi:glycosyltransferase family 2 protein [Agrococcus casei]|uniref:Putative glucosyl transferase n=1 Tax=Agrococcus casei LMG 22410 TaxID=1255656 RepID=A0A1R4F530_9MICO|nr:glycosyltransferase family 2 protein [Agrococcus casei]SJM50977.1 putative glucosyl transferase [Agrococcus casei LMG 22410]
MTMMVRDEADIIAAAIEHHLNQGFDRILVTDNASVDGTREILAEYAKHAPVTVYDDPEHRKQQAQTVTRMARLARLEFGADWVVNSDADEFVMSLRAGQTSADVIRSWPKSIVSTTVPVTNLVGPVAVSGGGLTTRMLWRDVRSPQQLQTAGVIAHPTPNTIHVGHPGVDVRQGNHFTSLLSRGAPEGGPGIEVLHVPWRSWEQFERKTINAGRGYEANPSLRPSPNHHGMRDWRRWKAGELLPSFVSRMITGTPSEADGFVREDALADALRATDPVLPQYMGPVVDAVREERFSEDEIARLLDQAGALVS